LLGVQYPLTVDVPKLKFPPASILPVTVPPLPIVTFPAAVMSPDTEAELPLVKFPPATKLIELTIEFPIEILPPAAIVTALALPLMLLLLAIVKSPATWSVIGELKLIVSLLPMVTLPVQL
jgi:hypothetical protein